MYCKNCGNILEDSDNICPICEKEVGAGNKFCENCGEPLSEGALVCLRCGQAIENNSSEKSFTEEKKKSKQYKREYNEK